MLPLYLHFESLTLPSFPPEILIGWPYRGQRLVCPLMLKWSIPERYLETSIGMSITYRISERAETQSGLRLDTRISIPLAITNITLLGTCLALIYDTVRSRGSALYVCVCKYPFWTHDLHLVDQDAVLDLSPWAVTAFFFIFKLKDITWIFPSCRWLSVCFCTPYITCFILCYPPWVFNTSEPWWTRGERGFDTKYDVWGRCCSNARARFYATIPSQNKTNHSIIKEGAIHCTSFPI